MLLDLQFDYAETTKNMELFKQKDIDEIHNWIIKVDKSKSVPKNLSNKQLVLFYNACYSDVDKTKLCIEKYYELRKNATELFDYRVWNADLSKAADVVELFHIPAKSLDGHEIIYHRLHDTDPSNFDLNTACKLLLMIVDMSLYKRGPRSGYIVIFDMEGIKIGHMTKLNLSTIRKLFQYLQEAAPIRMRGIHILNAEPLLDRLLLLSKPFIHQELFNMIKVHNKNEGLEKIYEIVPKSALPLDYGGELPDTQTIHKRSLEELQLLLSYFKAEEEQRMVTLSDKTRDSLQGTFRTLAID